jgi:hypothetical protein
MTRARGVAFLQFMSCEHFVVQTQRTSAMYKVWLVCHLWHVNLNEFWNVSSKGWIVFVRFQVLAAASMNIRDFWDIERRSLVADRRFRAAYCLYHQRDESPWLWRQYVHLKRRSTTRLHGAVSQKTLIFLDCFYLCGWGETISEFQTPTDQLVISRMVCECGKPRCNDIDRGNRSTCPSCPVYPPQIPHELSWARTRASAVRGRHLTARATPRLTKSVLHEDRVVCPTSDKTLTVSYALRGLAVH